MITCDHLTDLHVVVVVVEEHEGRGAKLDKLDNALVAQNCCIMGS